MSSSTVEMRSSVQKGSHMSSPTCRRIATWTSALFTLFACLSQAWAQTAVAGYAFNESSGTTAADASGHGLAGTLTNGAAFGPGKNGNAVVLDGLNDFVSLGNPPALRLTGSMTISAWINAQTFPLDDAAIVSKRGNGESGFQLDTTVDRGPRTVGFKLTNASGGSMFRYGTTVLQLNTWYHVAGIYNAAAQTLDVYVNGQLDNGALVGTITSSQQNSTMNVNLGQRPGVPGSFNFTGRLDDVRLYNRALSPTEIQADLNTPVGGTPAPNTPPTISAIGGQTVTEDAPTGNLAFTVGDAETAPASLVVSGGSSNTTLVPAANIVLGGTGGNRTVTVTPAPNQNGSATVTLTVSDGQLSTSTSFLLTVTPVNDSPTISSIANQATSVGAPVGPLAFTVGDLETAVASLILSGDSSSPTLLPVANIVFGGTGANRTVTATPAAGQSGTATITVSVSDGQLSASTSFQLTVTATPAGLLAAYAFNETTGHGHPRCVRQRPHRHPHQRRPVLGRQERQRRQPRRRQRLRESRRPGRPSAHGQHDRQRLDQRPGISVG
jgi:hypothetical protein